MVAFGKNAARWGSLSGWRLKFEEMRPEIEYRAKRAFLHVGPRWAEALVNEVSEHAFRTFTCLALRGKVDIVHAKPLAAAAISQVCTRRRLPGDRSEQTGRRFGR